MPSSLIGKTGDCWRLRYGALTMLKCLRTGLRPSLLWVAGLCFPSIHLSLLGLRSVLELLERYTKVAILDPIVGLPIPLPWAPSTILRSDSEFVKFTGVVSVFAVALPLACRLSVALARVGDERDWKEAAGARRTPRLGVALKLSRGLMVETLALWLCLQCLLFGCFGLVIGPLILVINALHIEWLGNWLLIPLAPPLLLVFLYASTLAALNQLALQSLVFNRRGPASALAHAWRLVRHDPWAVTRAMLVDIALQLVIFGMSPPSWDFFVLLLLAITGVARACYWARVYTALGGLRAVDGVPGLPAQTPPPLPPPIAHTA